MVASKDFDGLERLLRPLRRELRVELADAGTLSPAERQELESLVCANSLLGTLKVEARAVLASESSLG